MHYICWTCELFSTDYLPWYPSLLQFLQRWGLLRNCSSKTSQMCTNGDILGEGDGFGGMVGQGTVLTPCSLRKLMATWDRCGHVCCHSTPNVNQCIKKTERTLIEHFDQRLACQVINHLFRLLAVRNTRPYNDTAT